MTAGRPVDPSSSRIAAAQRAIRLLDAQPPLLVVSDFDGTLAPIVSEPGDARILPAARRALRALARVAEARPGRVHLAVLSGRPARDVAGLARAGGVRYLGSHGMEYGTLPRRGRPGRLPVATDPAHERHAPIVAALAADVAVRLGEPAWLLVEPKGASVGLHYRRAADPDAARAALLGALDAAERALGVTGLVRLEGRRVVEVRPADAVGKGGALARLVAELRPGAVLILGDDRTDADAFRVVRERRARGELDGLAVGVLAGRETPPELAALADVLVAGPSEAAAVLSHVARALAREPVALPPAADPRPAR